MPTEVKSVNGLNFSRSKKLVVETRQKKKDYQHPPDNLLNFRFVSL